MTDPTTLLSDHVFDNEMYAVFEKCPLELYKMTHEQGNIFYLVSPLGYMGEFVAVP